MYQRRNRRCPRKGQARCSLSAHHQSRRFSPQPQAMSDPRPERPVRHPTSSTFAVHHPSTIRLIVRVCAGSEQGQSPGSLSFSFEAQSAGNLSMVSCHAVADVPLPSRLLAACCLLVRQAFPLLACGSFCLPAPVHSPRSGVE